MKKFLLLTVILFFTIVAIGQKTERDTSQMTNYEKYVLAKEKDDNVNSLPEITENQTVENDDLYYTPSDNNKHIKKNKKQKEQTGCLI